MSRASTRLDALLGNVVLAEALCARGESPEVVATVCGTAAARTFWQRSLEELRESFGARDVVSLHENLPVNQAFGVLLCAQRLQPFLREGRGALAAFVFGDGTRSSPWTEAECGQKPALATFARAGGRVGRLRSMVELALLHFVPVQQYLRRSGFNGVVIKWGDEVQVPALDLQGRHARFAGADVVRFVSMQRMTDHLASQKDWVGVDGEGRVTAFLPRRPLAQMEVLAERGLLQRDAGGLVGGVNLGSIALSRVLLEELLDEFGVEVHDAGADRSRRPDLDPQFFTALTVASMPDAEQRADHWRRSLEESEALRTMERDLPGVFERLRRAVTRFEDRHGRPVKLVAMDFGELYWGDAGQHRQFGEFFCSLLGTGESGAVARGLAGLPETADSRGNRRLGHCVLGHEVVVENSVLVDVRLGRGTVRNSVLIGTRAEEVQALDSFDVASRVRSLTLRSAGAYRVLADGPVQAGLGERLTAVFEGDAPVLYRVHETTDLRDRAANYDVPILGNPRSFAALHAAVLADNPERVEAARRAFELGLSADSAFREHP